MKFKFYVRMISLALIMLAVFNLFAACDGASSANATNNGKNDAESDINNGTTEESTVVEASPDTIGIEKQNYDSELYMWVQTDCNPGDLYWLEESSGNAMDEAVYTRQEKVLEYLGVAIKGRKAGSHSEYDELFKTAVQNKDGSVDLLLTHVSSGVSGLIQEGYLRDFQDIDGINLDNEHWNHEFMDTLSIDDNYFLGFNDSNILYTYVIAFNKQMLGQLSLEGYSVDNLYEKVLKGEWTIDVFLDLAQKGFQDKGSGDKHIYGLVGMQWVPWCGFLHSSGINIVEQDESGTYKSVIMNDEYKEKTASLVDKLKNFSGSGYGSFTFQTGSEHPAARLHNGRALMELTSTHSLDNLLDYDISFGILPYPMFSNDQYDDSSKSLGYRSLQWGGNYGIPNYLRNEIMVGETLELFAFFSKPVQTTFYEKVLGKQVSEAPDDARMLDIVWSSVCSDMGQTFDGKTALLYLLPKVTWNGNGGQELVSYYATLQSAGNKNLAEFVQKVKKVAKQQEKLHGQN